LLGNNGVIDLEDSNITDVEIKDFYGFSQILYDDNPYTTDK